MLARWSALLLPKDNHVHADVGLRSLPFPSAHRERLNTPNHDILLRQVLGTAHAGFKARGVSITGYWHRYLHTIGH